MTWREHTDDELRDRVFAALRGNADYRRDAVLGFPGSTLDRRVFPPLPELAGFPLLSTFVANPNHIGCHTVGSSEPAFSGTHDLEREVVAICAQELLGAADPSSIDGYVASGGTESNIQALWAFRNRLRHDGVPASAIAVLSSADTHYSVAKGCDLLGLPHVVVPVDPDTRQMTPDAVRAGLEQARRAGAAHLLVVLNMGTTMYGSVDDVAVLDLIEEHGLPYLCHVDAAFGGFVYPLTADNPLSFRDPRITSITLDAHKMLQAPYGSGIHLIRKGFIEHVVTRDASYVPGYDCTLSGSRSGTNAVAVWMILQAYGPEGGRAFCTDLVARARRLNEALGARGIRTFHQPGMPLVALRAADIPAAVAQRHQLVPDDHHHATWWKIVVMDHVSDAHLDAFLADLDQST